MTYGLIYCVTNLENGKRYVGMTTLSVESRWRKHVSCSRESVVKSVFYRAIKQHGANKFVAEQIDSAETLEEIQQKERYWIYKLKSLVPDGYNLIDGGLNGHAVHEQTRIKLSEAMRKRWSDPSSKNDLIEAQRVAQKRPDVIASRDRARTEEWKQHLSRVFSGRKCPPPSEETRRKISEAQKGIPRLYARRPQSEEERRIRSLAAIKRYQRPGEREKTGAAIKNAKRRAA